MEESSEKPLPFHDISYFERFEIGTTILDLRFLKMTEERMEPIVVPDRKKPKPPRMCLTEWAVFGIYEGPEDNDHIKIRNGLGVIEKIPVAKLARGGLKTVEPEHCEIILRSMVAISQFLPVGRASDIVHRVKAVNILRDLIDHYEFLIPRARIAR